MLGLCLVNASVYWSQSLVMRGLCLGTHNRFQIFCISSSSEVDCSPPSQGANGRDAHAGHSPGQPIRGIHDHHRFSISDEADIRRPPAARPVP